MIPAEILRFLPAWRWEYLGFVPLAFALVTSLLAMIESRARARHAAATRAGLNRVAHRLADQDY